MDFINNAEWRYATKIFNKSRKVSAEKIQLLKRSIQLAPSSYGLQPYKVLIVEDPTLKTRLRAASWDQPQITDCSHLFIFCTYLDFTENIIDEYLDIVAETKRIDSESLSAYARLIKDDIAGKSNHERTCWARNQAYIALSNLLMCCAQERIDSCPMEGFSPARYNSILNLNKSGLNTCVVAAVGYRASYDASQRWLKVRKPLSLLFDEI